MVNAPVVDDTTTNFNPDLAAVGLASSIYLISKLVGANMIATVFRRRL
jgi:hypothetical protein